MSSTAPPQEHEPADADVVDSTAEEEPGNALAVQAPPNAIASARIVSGHDPDQIIAHASQIATSLQALVSAQGFAKDLGGNKPHLEIAAWQALGSMLGALGGEALHPETVWSRPVGERTTYHVLVKKWGTQNNKRVVTATEEYDVEGQDWEARVEIKTAAGVVVGVSEAMCSRSEKSWMQKPDPAVRSMAETRAASRAFRSALGWIVAMAGYNPTPAEELGDRPAAAPAQAAPAGPLYGKAASDVMVANARQALGYLLGVEPDTNPVGYVLNEIESFTKLKGDNADSTNKYLPNIALAAIVVAAKTVRERAAATTTEQPGAGDPAGETEEEAREREDAERIVEEAQQAEGDFT